MIKIKSRRFDFGKSATMENHRMIITPKELNDQKKDLLIVDIRPSNQRNETPLNGINSIVCENGEVSNIKE